MEEHQPESAAAGTADTTLIDGVEGSSFAAAGDRLHVHLNSSFSTTCLGIPRQHHKVPMFLWRS